ncbi:2675_t:CDS:2 [Gigaspora rosea]|nr:2675_t:CDS:2 [Gigaspora rosea]
MNKCNGMNPNVVMGQGKGTGANFASNGGGPFAPDNEATYLTSLTTFYDMIYDNMVKFPCLVVDPT